MQSRLDMVKKVPAGQKHRRLTDVANGHLEEQSGQKEKNFQKFYIGNPWQSKSGRS